MKKYQITAVTLVTSITGCTDPIVGDWNSVKITNTEDNSRTYDLPFEECQEYYGETYCSKIDFDMSIQEDLTGTMDLIFGVYEMDVTLDVENLGEGDYKIVGTHEEGDTIDFACTLFDAKNLQCTNDELEGIIDFTKQIAL